jgi:MoaD family protein
VVGFPVLNSLDKREWRALLNDYMNITFNYFAQVRQAAGVDMENVILPEGMDVAVAIVDAARRHGDVFRSLVLDLDNQTRPSLIVLLNGVPVSKGASSPLKDGDVVSLMSAVAGG